MDPTPPAARLIRHPAILLLQAAIIALAGWYAQGPALSGGWVWDDHLDIVANPRLRDAAGLGGIWLHPTGVNYFPLTATLQWVQWHLWQDHPAGYHWTNLCLHLLSALLLWRLLRKLGVRAAWLGGLLFAIHPLAVESVAWIAELKNTAALPLLLLAFSAWLDYDAGARRADYLRSLLLFLAAMLCKTTVAMFPACLLLHAWWRRGRLARTDGKAAAPFFAISLALGLVTIWFEQHRAIGATVIEVGGFLPRLAAAGLALAFYTWQSVLPVGLAPVYPRWPVDPPRLLAFLPWLVLATVAGWCWVKRAAWGRHLLFGGGWFFLHLLPALGLIPMAFQRLAWASDHFAYAALPGLIGVAAAGAGALRENLAGLRRALALAAAGAMLALLARASHDYARIFQSEEAFWSCAVARNPDAWIAHYNLGNELLRQGRFAEAANHYARTVQLKPDHDQAQNNWGNALAALGRPPEAVVHYEAALRLQPDSADAQVNLGNALIQLQRLPEAVAAYERALRAEPASARAHYNLANVLVRLHRLPEALAHYGAALEAEPASAATHYNFGNALAQAGRQETAIAQYRAALRLQPDYAEACANLGTALAQAGRLAEAVAQYEEALRLDPRDAVTRANLEQVRQQLRASASPGG